MSTRASLVLPFAMVIGLIAVWLADAWASGDGVAKSSTPSALAGVGLLFTLVLVAWSANSVRTMRRLAIGNDFGRLFSPHDSLDVSLSAFAAMVRSWHDADRCMVVLDDAHSNPARLYIADKSGPVATPGAGADPRLVRALLALPPERAALYERSALPLLRSNGREFHAETLEKGTADIAQLTALGNLLEAKSFISLPLRSRGQALGRVHVVSQRRSYGQREVRSLAQLMAQAGPLIENMQLVEQLAATVATHERRRISRDLHDGTVQPYIGLKLGLEALRRTLSSDAPVARELDELIGMAGEGIGQLREYVGRLNGVRRAPKRELLVQSLRSHVHRFAELYSIDARFVAASEIRVSSALCEEIINIVREGLSNIRRHTHARRASVELRSSDGTLFIEIVNDRGAQTPPVPRFKPRSICERARDLGGRVAVGERGDGDTVVSVAIPL